jgi:hypothetical protein
MGMMDILDRYAEGRPPLPCGEVEHDFTIIVHEAGPGTLEEGIAEAFRSGETPPFEEMVERLFERSDPQTRAGLLDNLLAGLGPNAIAALGGGALSDVLRRYLAGARVAPERAAAVLPEQVREAARQARRQNPGVLERVSRFYARRPALVRHLGDVAMGIALSRMARTTRH